MSGALAAQWALSTYDSSFTRSRSRSMSVGPPSRLYFPPPMQQTVVVDAALPQVVPEKEEKVRRRETIFGPDVGDDDQPGWTKPDEGNIVSADVVKRWVETAKSEEGLHATTTLQALVNLKRPTLLLQPLGHGPLPESDVTAAPAEENLAPLHLLKFGYDAMTPLVNVTLSVHSTDESVPPEPPRVVYTGTHPGGFNQSFTLPTSAALDLSSAIAPAPVAEPDKDEESINKDDNLRSQSEDTNRTSTDRGAANGATPDLAAIPELAGEQSPTPSEPRRRGFGIFSRRTRQPDVEQALEMTQTPAPQPEPTPTPPEPEPVKEPEHGMRLLISIEAVGPEGAPLRRRNAQLTHILISGTWVPDAGASGSNPPAGKRVWVVKVVRREAQIGSHSFLLKEIYGLSAAAPESSYPPSASDPYASAPNECIVCLTSPRDVVLLPCRHLVVCRECAVGMVEFGAGGRVARREEETPAPTGDAAGEGGDGAAGGTEAAAPPPPPPPAPRRKKKAKGWYCPVCRQPYTSLLRLALPASKLGSSAASASSEHDLSHTLARHPSRHSVVSTHTTRSVATLPARAEEMLSRLGPQDQDISDDDDSTPAPASQRPQFITAAARAISGSIRAPTPRAGSPLTGNSRPGSRAGSRPNSRPGTPLAMTPRSGTPLASPVPISTQLPGTPRAGSPVKEQEPKEQEPKEQEPTEAKEAKEQEPKRIPEGTV